MATITRFEDIEAWQTARKLTNLIYFVDLLGRAKGSSGEVRSQLYIALDRKYITQAQFDIAYDLADKASRQIYRFMSYLESKPDARRVREDRVEYNV